MQYIKKYNCHTMLLYCILAMDRSISMQTFGGCGTSCSYCSAPASVVPVFIVQAMTTVSWVFRALCHCEDVAGAKVYSLDIYVNGIVNIAATIWKLRTKAAQELAVTGWPWAWQEAESREEGLKMQQAEWEQRNPQFAKLEADVERLETDNAALLEYIQVG